MSRRTGWKDLGIGVISACAVVGAALGILIFGRVGRLHGKTITVYATTDGVRGLITGSEVWLDGQKVGLVRSVGFRPPSVNPRERLVIKMAVLADARPNLRLDSRVDIRAGTNLIGDQVVYLSSGPAKLRPVVDGDTIRGGRQSDTEEMTSDMALASREFPGIIENVKLLSAQLQTARGTIGAFQLDKGGPGIAAVREKSMRLLTRMSSGTGTLGRGMSAASAVRSRATAAMAQVDSIRALLGSNDYALGRFRRDSTLINEMTRVRAELADVERLAENPNGTIGRARTDSAIVRNISRDRAAMDSLVADMKKHPFRYIAF